MCMGSLNKYENYVPQLKRQSLHFKNPAMFSCDSLAALCTDQGCIKLAQLSSRTAGNARQYNFYE